MCSARMPSRSSCASSDAPSPRSFAAWARSWRCRARQKRAFSLPAARQSIIAYSPQSRTKPPCLNPSCELALAGSWRLAVHIKAVEKRIWSSWGAGGALEVLWTGREGGREVPASLPVHPYGAVPRREGSTQPWVALPPGGSECSCVRCCRSWGDTGQMLHHTSQMDWQELGRDR